MDAGSQRCRGVFEGHHEEGSQLVKYQIYPNEDAGRYEVSIDGTLAKIDFQMMNGLLALVHTEVPTAISNRGVASELTTFALEDARTRGLQVLPFCPFVSAHIKRHPETLVLVSDRFKAKESLRT